MASTRDSLSYARGDVGGEWVEVIDDDDGEGGRGVI